MFKKDETKKVKVEITDFEKAVKKIHRFARHETSGIKHYIYTKKEGELLAMDNKSANNAWKKALHNIS